MRGSIPLGLTGGALIQPPFQAPLRGEISEGFSVAILVSPLLVGVLALSVPGAVFSEPSAILGPTCPCLPPSLCVIFTARRSSYLQ